MGHSIAEVYFLSTNKGKIEETTQILSGFGINSEPVSDKIEELQTDKLELIVTDKLKKAFIRVGRPIIVEHTGMEIESLNGFPGGLTQVFWKRITNDDKDKRIFTSLFGRGNSSAVIRSVIGYCDCREIFLFEGKISGKISDEPRGSDGFQWDSVFIPDGLKVTFAEMGRLEKNKISMRFHALKKFADHFNGKKHGKGS